MRWIDVEDIKKFSDDLQDYNRVAEIFFEQTYKDIGFTCGKCGTMHTIKVHGKTGMFNCNVCHTTYLYKYFFIVDKFVFVEQKFDWRSFKRQHQQEERHEEYVHEHKTTLSDFDILGIPWTRNAAAVKKAYRELCKRFHPDLNAGMPVAERIAAEEKMKEVNRAYDGIMLTFK